LSARQKLTLEVPDHKGELEPLPSGRSVRGSKLPSRILREGIIGSARVNALSFGAELFYRRLMSVADDYGRFHASPITLRGSCWPTCPERVSEAEIVSWLAECRAGEAPLVIVYNSGGAEFLEIQDFRQQTRTKSKFPDCLSNAKQMLSRCEANAQPSRIRISESYSKSAALEEPPNKTKTFPRSPQAEASELVCSFPGADCLPGEPDEEILDRCLDLVGGSAEGLGITLRAMFLAGKKPSISWAWFPKVVKQYASPNRMVVQREARRA
jgi:hypothetical protein